MTAFKKVSDTTWYLFAGALVLQCCSVISGTIFCLYYSDDDCDKPLRAWLIVDAVVISVIFLLSFKWKLISFGIWTSWNLLWTIVTAIWIYSDDHCDSDFSYGFTAASIFLTCNVFLLSIKFLVLCVFGIAAFIGYGLMSNYEEIE